MNIHPAKEGTRTNDERKSLMGYDKKEWLSGLDRDARVAGGTGLPDSIMKRLDRLSYEEVGHWVEVLNSQIPPTEAQLPWLKSLGLTALTRRDAARAIKGAQEAAQKPVDPADVQRRVREREEAAALRDEEIAMRHLRERDERVRMYELGHDDLLPIVRGWVAEYGAATEKKIRGSIPPQYLDKFLSVLHVVQPVAEPMREPDFEDVLAGVEL